MAGLHAQRVNSVTVWTVGSEPWRGSLSDRTLISENRCTALFVSTGSPARSLCAGFGRPRETLHSASTAERIEHLNRCKIVASGDRQEQLRICANPRNRALHISQPGPFRWRETGVCPSWGVGSRSPTAWSAREIELQALATLAALAQISTPSAAHFLKSHQLLVQKFAADRDRQKKPALSLSKRDFHANKLVFNR
jgi:hypothetical protein